jgi:CheY-like chemotaxis protein
MAGVIADAFAGRQPADSFRLSVMLDGPTVRRNLLVVDDDAVMRELLAAVIGMEGYRVAVAESGEEALALLAESSAEIEMMLVDLHMPGVQGADLAKRLHSASAPGTLLIGMSGSELKREDAALFDGFLRKPFTVEEFKRTVEVAENASAESAQVMTPDALGTDVLDEEVFRKLASILPKVQLRELYRITVEDVQRRLEKMRAAVKRGDLATVHAEAHAIKGGCGMVGASELSALATALENSSEVGNPPFGEFHDACVRLQVMLDARL